MKNISTIGRICFALPFAVFGINHFIMMDYYLGTLTSFIPRSPYVMMLTGVLMIAVSISIITKLLVRLSTILLAAMLLVFILTIHIPHLVAGIDTEVSLISLLKDISLMGGALMIAGIYQDNGKTNPKTL